MKTKLKQWIPKKTTILKSLIIIFILSICSTYLSSVLAKQERIIPDNPFQETALDYSSVPLYGAHLDLIHGEENNDKNDEQLDEENNKDNEGKSTSKKDTNDNQTKKENNEDIEESKGDSEPGTTENKDGVATADKNDDSPHKEIVDVEDEDADDLDETNGYFTTSIKNGEVVAESMYAFQIKQLKHDYELEQIDVRIDEKDGKVVDISNDYSQPVTAQVNLAEGENNIKVAVTYRDEASVTFTVLRSYTVIYDENKIVIESDLQNQDVKEEKLSFKASAKQGNKQVPLTVHIQHDNEKITLESTKKNEYTATLKEGKNELILIATSGNQTEEETYIVHYEKPKQPHIEIITDLVDYHDKKVKEENLQFTAEAYDDGEKIDINVTHNGSAIDSDDNTYSVTLDEGENTFKLQAEKNDVSKEVLYTVYYEPDATGGEDEEKPNEQQPEITVSDIADGETIHNSIRTFHVKAKDYQGNSITQSGKINVTNNGEAVPRDWTDGNQISFTLPIHNGTNEIIINAEDTEGNKASKTLTIHGKVDEDGAPIGTATVSMEATTVGLGYLIPPREVELYQGERASYVLDRVLKDAGFDYMNTGSLDSSFYMSAVHKPGISSSLSIPDDLQETLEEHGVTVDLTNIHPDVLGEMDFTGDSGWMYSVNGVYANVGFADYYLKDGDELRIRFTLAEGNDIGLGQNNFHKEW